MQEWSWYASHLPDGCAPYPYYPFSFPYDPRLSHYPPYYYNTHAANQTVTLKPELGESVDFPIQLLELSLVIKGLANNYPLDQIPSHFSSARLELLQSYVNLLVEDPKLMEQKIWVTSDKDLGLLLEIADYYRIEPIVNAINYFQNAGGLDELQSQVNQFVREDLQKNPDQTIQGILSNRLQEEDYGVIAILLDRITNLDLSGLGLTTLNPNLLNRLIHLEKLMLTGNRLSTLPEGLFNGLNDLRFLYLNNNQLQTIRETVFEGAPNLEILGLGGNRLTTLPPLLFAKNRKLEEIQLNNNELQSLNEKLFNNLDQLRVLFLNFNHLTTLEEALFNNQKKLQELYLNDNNLTNLPRNVFSQLDSLQALYLSDNQLRMTLEDFKYYYPLPRGVDLEYEPQRRSS